MKSQYKLSWMAALWILALATTAHAEVVYTQVRAVIPTVGNYQIDLNRDGIVDFTLQSTMGLVWCQNGDGGYWKLTVESSPGNGLVVDVNQYAVALPNAIPIGSGQTFAGGTTLMTQFDFGSCSQLVLGDWFNVPNRYLGVRFQITVNGVPEIHYGWVKVSDAAYVDRFGNFYATTLVSGFAYETVPGQPIMTGQTSILADDGALLCSSGDTRQCSP